MASLPVPGGAALPASAGGAHSRVTPLGNLSIGGIPVPIVLTDFVSALAQRRLKDRLRAADWRGISPEDTETNATAMLWQEVFIAGAGLIADCPATLDQWRVDTLPAFIAAIDNVPPFPKSVTLPIREDVAEALNLLPALENNP